MTTAPPDVNVRPKRVQIDFHHVEEGHEEIHHRLENWARWCRGRQSPTASPMFRMAQASARSKAEYGALTATMVDPADAVRIAKLLWRLPEPHRKALQWCYVKPVSPLAAARDLGTNFDGLYRFVRDGRQMLINLGA